MSITRIGDIEALGDLCNQLTKYEDALRENLHEIEISFTDATESSKGEAIRAIVDVMNQMSTKVFREYPEYISKYRKSMSDYYGRVKGLGFQSKVCSDTDEVAEYSRDFEILQINRTLDEVSEINARINEAAGILNMPEMYNAISIDRQERFVQQIQSSVQKVKNTATVLSESQRIFIEELTEIKAGFEELVGLVQNIVVFTHPVAGVSVSNLLVFLESGMIKAKDIPEYLGKLKKAGDARAMEYLLAGEYAMFLELNPESVSEELYDIFMKRMGNNEVPLEVLDEYGEMIRRLTEIRELMDKYGPQVEAFYQGLVSDIKGMTAREYELYIIGNTGYRRIDHDLIFLTSMIVYTIPLAEGEALLEVLKGTNGVLPEEYRGKYGHYVEMIELCYKSSGQNLTMAELDEGFNRQFKAERGGFFTYLCTTTAVSVNTKANNPAPSDASLDPANNRFDAMEVESRNGFKEYSYEPLPQGSWTNQGASTMGVPDSQKPNQVHHFLSDKNSTYTSQFEDILKKYDLSLDDDWNKELLPHQGRHPNAYHDFVLEQMQAADDVALGDEDIFLDLFQENVKNPVIDNPDMLYSSYWE